MDLVVVTTGGRAYDNRSVVYRILDDISERHKIVVVMHGACPVGIGGLDWLVDDWAEDRSIPCLRFPPDPRDEEKRFFRRNYRMVKHAVDIAARKDSRIPIVIAFPGGKGTEMTASISRGFGIRVKQVDK